MATSQMSRILAVIAVLLVAFSSAHAALTAGEKQALAQLRTAFPSLARVQQDPNVYSYLDGASQSWPSTFDSLCMGADGYEIHGVRCVSGHVGGLFFSDAWGAMDLAKSLSQISSLTYLKEFRVYKLKASAEAGFSALSAAVFSNLALETVACLEAPGVDTSLLDSDAWFNLMAAESSLLSLTMNCPASRYLNTTRLNKLEYLELGPYTTYSSGIIDNLFPLNLTLRHLYIHGVSRESTGGLTLTNLYDIELFTVLETADLAIMYGDPLEVQLPTTLKTFNLLIRAASSTPQVVLYMDDYPEDPIQAAVTIDCPDAPAFLQQIPTGIKSLTLFTTKLAAGLDLPFPKSLEALIVKSDEVPDSSNVDHSLANCANLKTLSLSGFISSLIPNLPNLNETSINNLTIGERNIVAEEVITELLCVKLPSPANLVYLSLQDTVLPNCTAVVGVGYTNLKTFITNSPGSFADSASIRSEIFDRLPSTLTSFEMISFSIMDPAPLDWDAFLQFPHLQRFTIQGFAGALSPFPASQLVALSNTLTSVSIAGNLQGTIPSNFFVQMPHLTSFSVNSCGRLNGTFPSAGLQNLKYLDAGSNMFTSWPSPVAAPQLEFLRFDDNDLATIPYDADFAAMTKLKFASFFGSYHSENIPEPLWTSADSAFLPIFWGNHASIERVDFSNSYMHGPLPTTITSKHLTYVNAANNLVCGHLFEATPSVGLQFLDLTNNIISGTIPASWKDLSISEYLGISANQLNGTFPAGFLGNGSYTMEALEVHLNFFHGPLPNLADFTNLLELSTHHTALDLCAGSPTIPETLSDCRLDPTANLACQCPQIWAAPCRLNCGAIPPASLAPYSDLSDILPTPVNVSVCTAAPLPPTPPSTPPTTAAPTQTSAASSSSAASLLLAALLAVALLAQH